MEHQVSQDNNPHFLQIKSDDGRVLITVGSPSKPSQDRFVEYCIWQGKGEQESNPVVYCRIYAAGSIAGGKDDPESAWLGAVEEGHKMAKIKL